MLKEIKSIPLATFLSQLGHNRGLQIVYIYDDGEELDLSHNLKIEYS